MLALKNMSGVKQWTISLIVILNWAESGNICMLNFIGMENDAMLDPFMTLVCEYTYR